MKGALCLRFGRLRRRCRPLTFARQASKESSIGARRKMRDERFLIDGKHLARGRGVPVDHHAATGSATDGSFLETKTGVEEIAVRMVRPGVTSHYPRLGRAVASFASMIRFKSWSSPTSSGVISTFKPRNRSSSFFRARARAGKTWRSIAPSLIASPGLRSRRRGHHETWAWCTQDCFGSDAGEIGYSAEAELPLRGNFRRPHLLGKDSRRQSWDGIRHDPTIGNFRRAWPTQKRSSDGGR